MAVRTIYWNNDDNKANLLEAAAILAKGGTVAFATETVYGLGADARSTDAVGKIFAAKGRPSDNPLIVHIANAADAGKLARQIDSLEQRLMDVFWPGPLTLVLPARPDAVSPLVTAGLDTVAVRMPAHPSARELIRLSGCPIAAPSANLSGRPSPTEAKHVAEDLDGRIDGVLDGGPSGIGLESTVVRVVAGEVHILRPGGVTRERLREALGPQTRIWPERAEEISERDGDTESDLPNERGAGGEAQRPSKRGEVDERHPQSGQGDGVELHPQSEQYGGTGPHRAELQRSSEGAEAPRSPGVKYTHYAPRGEMLLITGASERLPAAVQAAADDASAVGRRVGILACSENAALYRAGHIMDCGPRLQPESAASRLYAQLRSCDDLGLDYIVAEGYPETGAGEALMNRLRKAAGGNERRV